MNDILEAIVSLFEADDSGKWIQDQIDHAHRKWEELSPEAKNFLVTLSSEDLENICIGEVRDQERDDGEWITLRLYNGAWQTLPPEVNYFLETIWEYTS